MIHHLVGVIAVVGKDGDAAVRVSVSARSSSSAALREQMVTFIDKMRENGADTEAEIVERYMETAEQEGVTLTRDEVMDELAADFAGDMLDDADLFAKFSKENRTAAQKLLDSLKEFLAKVKTAFTGKYRDMAAQEAYGKDFAELEDIAKQWQAAFDAAERQAEKTKTAAGEGDGVRYSLKTIIGNSGKNYGIGVYLDSTLLENLTAKEREQMVKERVKELGGQHFTAYDGNGNAVDVQIAAPNARFVNKNGKSVPVNKDLATKNRGSRIKQEAVVLADELVSAARYKKSRPANYPHGWLDDNGRNEWAEWKTYIQDKENSVWEATLHIATSATGEKFLYDIDPIKMAEQSGNSDTSTANDSIPADGVNVKSQFSLKTYSEAEKKDHVKSAKEFFGKTYSWNETGYITTDGTKLDFSGRHDGGPGGQTGRRGDGRDRRGAV